MQYLNEIGNKIQSIEEFFNIQAELYANPKIVNVKYRPNYIFRHEELYTVPISNTDPNATLIVVKDNTCNIPYVLPDGSCILTVKHENTVFRATKHEYITFKVKFNEGHISEIYMITNFCNNITMTKIDKTSQIYSEIASEVIGAIVIKYMIDQLKKAIVKQRVYNTTTYTDGSYYVGDHINNIRNGFGTYVCENNYIFCGKWGYDGFPIKGYLIIYADGTRHCINVEFNEYDHTQPTYITANNEGFIYETVQFLDDNGEVLYTIPNDNFILRLNKDVILAGRYIIFLDKLEIINRKNVVEEYKFDSRGTFMWWKLDYKKENKLIYIDTNLVFYIINKPFYTIYTTVSWNSTNANISLSYNEDYSYTYKVTDENDKLICNGCTNMNETNFINEFVMKRNDKLDHIFDDKTNGISLCIKNNSINVVSFENDKSGLYVSNSLTIKFIADTINIMVTSDFRSYETGRFYSAYAIDDEFNATLLNSGYDK